MASDAADYSSVSYWLESCGDDLTPRPPLDGSLDVDIAVLGAGYTGLWTAYSLLERDPTLRVLIVEREIAGFGASGRNGAWCTSGFGAGPDLLTHHYGREAARAVHDAMVATVDEIGRVVNAEGIDAQYQKDGELSLAVGKHQLPALDAVQRTYDRLGVPEFAHRLDEAAAKERLDVAGLVGGIWFPATAAVHPGRLVRGLARAVERKGAAIVEGTAVTNVRTGARPALETNRGTVGAGVVVLAGESYLSGLPGFTRAVLPIYSLIVITEPLTDAQLAEIHWTHRAVVHSQALTVDYLSRTQDGRVLFGGRGAPYHYGSAIRPEFDRHRPTHERLRQSIVEWFPSLAGVRTTHAWGGTVGVPRDFIPTMAYDRATGIATSHGYTGEGVAATNLGGRVLADLITGAESELTRLPMVNHRTRAWEPEPFRFLAARYLQYASLKLDERGARSGRPLTGRTLAERLIGH
jgi:glycine/D-amino acid oxidase-like deaminating enzyme